MITTQAARDPARCPHAVWKFLAVATSLYHFARIAVINIRAEGCTRKVTIN